MELLCRSTRLVDDVLTLPARKVPTSTLGRMVGRSVVAATLVTVPRVRSRQLK